MPPLLDTRFPLHPSDVIAHNNVGRVTLVFRWMLTMLRRFICLVTGHKTILHFERNRLALRCLDCGYQTPGWTIGEFTPSRVITPIPRQNVTADDRAA
jgi:hypothetical protein